jgi:hypothetical protein
MYFTGHHGDRHVIVGDDAGVAFGDASQDQSGLCIEHERDPV